MYNAHFTLRTDKTSVIKIQNSLKKGVQFIFCKRQPLFGSIKYTKQLKERFI
jgi:hypothetical protein